MLQKLPERCSALRGIPDPCGYQSGVGELRPREKKNTEVPRPCREAPGRGNGGKSDAATYAATYRVGAQMLATGDPAASGCVCNFYQLNV